MYLNLILVPLKWIPAKYIKNNSLLSSIVHFLFLFTLIMPELGFFPCSESLFSHENTCPYACTFLYFHFSGFFFSRLKFTEEKYILEIKKPTAVIVSFCDLPIDEWMNGQLNEQIKATFKKLFKCQNQLLINHTLAENALNSVYWASLLRTSNKD